MKKRVSPIFSKPVFRLALGILISLLSLYLALRNVQFGEIWQAILQADPVFVALALASIAINTLAKTIRWRVLLGAPGKQIPLGLLLQSVLVGQMINTLYPARIGDLTRAYITGRQTTGTSAASPGRTFTLGTIVLEKMIDTVAYGLLFFLLVLLMPLPAWLSSSVTTFTLMVLAASGAVFAMAFRPAWFLRQGENLLRLLPERMRRLEGGRYRMGMASLAVLQDRGAWLQLGFWSAVSWGTAILNNQLALLAMHIHLPWTASLLTLMVLQAGISIPSVPGKIGIFEYSVVLALSVFVVAQAQALSYSFLLHTLVLLPATLLGLLFFWTLGLGFRSEVLAEGSALASLEQPAD